MITHACIAHLFTLSGPGGRFSFHDVIFSEIGIFNEVENLIQTKPQYIPGRCVIAVKSWFPCVLGPGPLGKNPGQRGTRHTRGHTFMEVSPHPDQLEMWF